MEQPGISEVAAVHVAGKPLNYPPALPDTRLLQWLQANFGAIKTDPIQDPGTVMIFANTVFL